VTLRFPKSARLARSSEFLRVRREGKAVHGKFVVLSAVNAGAETRVGFITSRRVGGAVERNRVRRRLREVVRAMRPNLQPGWWVVTVARPAAVEASFAELQQEWLRLARKLQIIPECSSSV
jgi:ribonuclease P protein component